MGGIVSEKQGGVMTRLIAIVLLALSICAVSLPDKRKTAKRGSDWLSLAASFVYC